MTAIRRDIAGWSIRWDAALAEQSYADGLWMHETIGDVAARVAAATPDLVLVLDGATLLTAGVLYAQARTLAGALIGRGLKPGDVVSFMLPNWHEACVIYLACTLAGLVAHPLVPAYREREVAFMMQDCGSRFVFIPSKFRNFDYVAMLGRVCADVGQDITVVVLRGDAGPFLPFNALLQEGSEDAALPVVDPESVKLVLYTSGTTGRAKAVLHTHNSICADIVQIHRHWKTGSDAVFLVPSPVSHIGGSLYAFEQPWQFGTPAVLMDVWQADAALGLIERHRVTHCAAATPFLRQLLDAATLRGIKLASLRLFVCGGASVPPDLVRSAQAFFASCAVTRVYGSTEVPTLTIGARDWSDLQAAAETDGARGIATLRLIDEAGTAVLAGQEGEVCARGPQMLAGYLHTEDERGAFTADGFFRMGDLGRLADDDHLVISGRKKDLIIRAGENISPKEVEDLLNKHPDINDIAIVGLPSARTGEMACAAIVPAGAAEPDLASLSAWLIAQGLARFKIPERVVLVAELPRNPAGKVLKHVLRDRLLAES